jgi:hypothetical protein
VSRFDGGKGRVGCHIKCGKYFLWQEIGSFCVVDVFRGEWNMSKMGKLS